MKVYHEIKDMLERELEQIADKHELTSNNLEVMDKVVDIIKDIETICAMREAGEDYSYGHPYYMYDDGMDYSNARGRRGYVKRDSMGRYSTEGYMMRDGYSRASQDDSRGNMVMELDRLEREATDETQRNMIRNWKNQLKNA